MQLLELLSLVWIIGYIVTICILVMHSKGEHFNRLEVFLISTLIFIWPVIWAANIVDAIQQYNIDKK